MSISYEKVLYYLSILLISFVYSNDKTYSGTDSDGIPYDTGLIKIFDKRNGIFVEVGAYDGISYSNTKLLEELYDWTGILIEPSKCLFPTLLKNRPKAICLNCALGSFEQDGLYLYGDFDGTPMSSISGRRLNRIPKHSVLVRSLQSILDDAQITHVDFFSLDVEGYEFQVLQGIDYNKVTFDYLLIELYLSEYEDVVEFLNDVGYELIENISHFNLIQNPGWDGTHNDYLFKRKNI